MVRAVEFRLLGPVEVDVDGRRLDLGRRRQQRCVLAVLALEHERVVPVERLEDLLWDGAPSGSVRSALHAHVSRLRRCLAPAEEYEVRLVTRGSGYMLQAGSAAVDVEGFRRLVERGRAADDAEVRAEVLAQALSLWRGPLLADVASDRLRDRVGSGLQELRLVAVEARYDAELEVGRHRRAVPDLTDLVEAHPLREHLVGLLMTALYRSGRGPDALEVYRQAHARLAEELGIDPGRRLRLLHEAILRDDPSLHAHPPSMGAPVVRPAQLPSATAHFTGRDPQLAELDRLLTGERAKTVVISAVSGTAGVGKTALAVHWAHRVAERFPDGQLYVNLRGFDVESVMPAAEAVRGFLDALGVPAPRIPADLPAQAALYRSLLAGRRMLVVLDNARDAAQVRPLLPGAPGCLVLVTSRNQLTSLVAAEGAQPLTLDLLTALESRQLLTRRLGARRVAAEPLAVEEIITWCGWLPLALAIVAARAASQPAFALAAVAGELRRARGGLDAFSTGDAATDLRVVLSWSYQALSAEAARLFRLLGLCPGPDIAAPGAASLAALGVEQVRPLLAELTRAHLITQHLPGRYAFHDLLRVYAAEQARQLDSEPDRRAATTRMLDHYLHTAHTAERLLNPTRGTIALTPSNPGVTPETFTGHDAATAWFSVELQVLLAAIDHAATIGLDIHTWQLAWSLTTFLNRRGHWQCQTTALHHGLAAARRLADQPAQANAHNHLARTYLRLGRHDDALTHLQHALDLYGQTGDKAGQAHTHDILAHVRERQGSYADALEHARQALRLYRTVGDRKGQAYTLNNVGWAYALVGDHQQALSHCQQSLTLHQELGDRNGQASAWDSLGYAHHHRGHHAQAVDCYQHAVDLFQDLGDRYNEADVLTHLGDTYHTTGAPDAARDARRQALAILTELDHPDADLVRAKLQGVNHQRPPLAPATVVRPPAG